jgi:2-dehydro-3-deoxyphosphogluconate aldolase / (4S)-4-hydroxy-2-oxoglutarate aldolase
MHFTKEAIINQMKESGVVPLFTHENADEAFEVISVAYRAGIRLFEITNRKSNSFEVFSQLIKRADELPGLMLGIGTVIDGPTTKKFIDAGAHFIISPIMNLEMATVCHAHNIMWIPGCATLTEIVTAKQHGAEVIKVFPGSVLGPGFLSAIMPVVPDLKLMITGGVEPTREGLSIWFAAGAMCVGLGSQLFLKDILVRRDWPSLELRIKRTLEIAREVRTWYV